MKLSSKPLIAATVIIVVSLIGSLLTSHAATQQRGQVQSAGGKKAGEFFKNVTTAPLKALTVDDFMGSMGVISASLGFDCADCHEGAGYDEVDWAADTDKKIKARKMIEMVGAINRTHFAGVQVVTCWTCHHGRDVPAPTIAIDRLYGSPNDEKDDIIPAAPGQGSADRILDKYIDASGGAQRLAGLSSFIATGTSTGYEGAGGDGRFQIFAKAPDQRTTLIEFKDHPERGNSTRAYNGRAGWIKTPRAAVGLYELTGGELDGARLDAQMSFPGQIKKVLTNLHAGYPESLNGREVEIVQGNGPRGLLVTMYFDRQSGLLVRFVRSFRTPIGRIPTQVDYSDYRDVGGIKFPFQYTFSWLDGRDSFQVTDVKTNVPIDETKFGKP